MKEEIIRELLAKERYDLNDLVQIMAILRSEGGCPWDREQTHKSIRNCMIEEAYEVVEAIDTENPTLLREELGDVLFQVIFHSRLSEEEGQFNVNDVIHDVSAKMIQRHPHVFAGREVTGGEDALRIWNDVKTEEKQRKTLSMRLRAIPPMMPALLRAQKAEGKMGVAKDADEQVLKDRLQDGMRDLLTSEDRERAVGDFLLTLCGLTEFWNVSAEEALAKAVERTIRSVESHERNEN